MKILRFIFAFVFNGFITFFFLRLTLFGFVCLLSDMKHFFLVSLTIPEDIKYDSQQSWLGFLDRYPVHKEAPAGIQRLAQNVWLIERANGAIFLSRLVSDADGSGLNPQVRFLMEDEIEFSQ